ncbi:MAG TPA: ABC transporter permease [Thermohalobaculum sp.]|nr:ABC transporter permease [Thermohalobaculum sp.]
MNPELVLRHWDLFLGGVWVTLHLTAIALALGMLIALPCSLAMSRGGPLAPLVRGYVYVFRGTPLLVQAYLIYYGLAQFEFVRESWAWIFLREAWWCAVIAFSLNSGAYTAEILRGAIATTPKGELEAARSVGLTERQVTWLVLLPSAMRRALPQYGNEVVFMLHSSVIASVITIQDILGVGRTVNAKYYVAYEGFLTAAVLYMVLTYLVVSLFRRVEDRYLRHLRIQPAAVPKDLAMPPGLPQVH